MKKLLLLIIATSFSLSLAKTAEEKIQKEKIKALIRFERMIIKCAESTGTDSNTNLFSKTGKKYMNCTASLDKNGAMLRQAFWNNDALMIERDSFEYAKAVLEARELKRRCKHYTINEFNELARKNLKERFACASITDPKKRHLKYIELMTIPNDNANAN